MYVLGGRDTPTIYFNAQSTRTVSTRAKEVGGDRVGRGARERNNNSCLMLEVDLRKVERKPEKGLAWRT